MLKSFKHLKPREWLYIVISVVFICIQVWLDLKSPDYMAQITTLVQTPGSAMGDIWAEGLKMLLCALGSMLTSVAVGFLAANVATSFAATLRGKVFDKVMSFSMEEINKFSTSSLITRTTNDITQMQMLIAIGLQIIVKSPIVAVWAMLKIADKFVSADTSDGLRLSADSSGIEWLWVVGIAVLFMVTIISVLLIFAMPRFKKVQKLTDNLNRVTRENLMGLRIVRSFNAEDYQEEKFERANSDLTYTHLYIGRLMSILPAGMGFVMSGINLAIYWLGAALINGAGMAEKLPLFSTMVVFSSYAVQIIMAFMMMSMIFIMLPRASVSASRINEVLETKEMIIDGPVSGGKTEKTGEVVFNNVSFKYPDADEYVLHNVSFRAEKGETVAFIGSTGSGKSTLINLIPRFYDVTEGELLIDGINVKEYTQAALHNKLGYVSQKAVLFSGTVKENVAYGDNGDATPSEEEIKRALDIAQGRDFVDAMEDGFDSNIAQGGANISGGQKQRLSIARAICRKPEIYIFDDSFSALDYKTDRLLRNALKKETGDATTMIVAQRIGTIKDADKIVVLDEGNVVGIGTHKELLSDCEVYRQIAYSQLSKEELSDV
ncbi:MAG: ABC transporter ATP-binding protein/permease [Oscillospiraceae bacterium]|jgi:ATP-binding cassette subfamily B protein|nr:ABC transporter ATP-binding protein/permease [Oscillospiraceae bacterium]